MSQVKLRRALLSVADKTGLSELGQGLAETDVELISTGGTGACLREAGLDVTDVSAVTSHPEIFSGRVKTLHPKIHGGILARLPDDEGELRENAIEVLDLVVVNLYRFEDAVASGAGLPDLVEKIDIGGPAMLRAAAKNFARVAILTDPAQYAGFLAELRETGGISLETRQDLAVAAFAKSSAYDVAIHAALSQRLGAEDTGLPANLSLQLTRVGEPLRYGENPHQRGAFYSTGTGGLGSAKLDAGGKALSYNNLLDLDGALSLVNDLPAPAACVIKHAGPCGAATGPSASAALEAAWEGDPLSAFGSVVGFNVPLDLPTAEVLVTRGFIEAIVAPSIEPEARDRIRARKGWGRTVRLVSATPPTPALALRSVAGGLLAQDEDRAEPATWEVVSERAPSAEEDAALRFGWRCVRALRSNAIALAFSPGSGLLALAGVGGGQPSRVDAVGIAVRKAGEKARGAVLASDAFFPFPDGVEAAAEAGVTAIVQPGGSKKDPQVIARANELGVAMVLTGTRCFRH